MTDSNYNWTPAAQGALGIDPDRPPMEETWSYRSIVGMLASLPTLAPTSRLPSAKLPGSATAQTRVTPPPSRLLFATYTAPAKWA
jgi:hypothetical protein